MKIHLIMNALLAIRLVLIALIIPILLVLNAVILLHLQDFYIKINALIHALLDFMKIHKIMNAHHVILLVMVIQIYKNLF
jgi:hypothetical protein